MVKSQVWGISFMMLYRKPCHLHADFNYILMRLTRFSKKRNKKNCPNLGNGHQAVYCHSTPILPKMTFKKTLDLRSRSRENRSPVVPTNKKSTENVYHYTTHHMISNSQISSESPIFEKCCVCFLSKQRKSYARVDAKHTINFKRPY